jgi:hypothetical protein
MRSDAFLRHIGTGLMLHADFGAEPRTGIPYVLVPASQPRVPMQFTFASQSDPGPYPFPDDVPIQGGRDAPGDRHAVVIDSSACLLYETFDTHWLGPGLGYSDRARSSICAPAPRDRTALPARQLQGFPSFRA